MEIKVYETKEYSKFTLLKGNRDIKQIKKIKASIANVGYIPSPILCNENLEIIDGQNRFEALKSLDMPIHYYIVEGIGIEEARALNIGRTNWNTLDYVKSYAESGNESYKRLLKLIENYPKFSTQEIIGIVQNIIVSNGFAVSVNTGELVVTESDAKEAKTKLEAMLPLSEVRTKVLGSKRIFTTGVAWCCGVDKVNAERLIKTIKSKYPLIRPVVSIEYLLSDLSNIYNAGLKSKANHKYFDYEYKISR